MNFSLFSHHQDTVNGHPDDFNKSVFVFNHNSNYPFDHKKLTLISYLFSSIMAIEVDQKPANVLHNIDFSVSDSSVQFQTY